MICNVHWHIGKNDIVKNQDRDVWYLYQTILNFYKNKRARCSILYYGKKYNKLSKGVWRMPRLSEAMKDVISCEKLRGEAHILWSVNIRMGQPSMLKAYYLFIGANPVNWNIQVTGGRENKSDSVSSGERTRISPNQCCYGNTGVVGPRYSKLSELELFGKTDHRGW